MELSELYSYFAAHPQITTDSRDCPAGSIFIALKGETFNGNAYAASALEKGCAIAVIDEKEYLTDDPRYVLVDSALQTLKDLARTYRRQFKIPVIGITGTNGKTTTKELIAAVLKEKYNVLSTQGNFNNDVGVPKTLLRLQKEHEIAVVEMGASHPGDIKTLVETAEPTCGLITSVGRAHLQGFGSLEGVMKTKGELYDYLIEADHNNRHDIIPIFINADNEYLMQMARDRHAEEVIFYGLGTHPDISIQGEIIGCAPFLSFRWRLQNNFFGSNSDWYVVNTHLIGAYNIENLLAAITIGYHFGVMPENINHALNNYIPQNNRSQLTVTEHNKLIVDAYNANPTSMAAALENFQRMEVEHKMAILGEMRELGDATEEEHQKMIDQLKEAHFDTVWLVGEIFSKYDCEFRKFNNVEEVIETLQEQPVENHYILLKGSNSVGLYRLKDYL